MYRPMRRGHVPGHVRVTVCSGMSTERCSSPGNSRLTQRSVLGSLLTCVGNVWRQRDAGCHTNQHATQQLHRSRTHAMRSHTADGSRMGRITPRGFHRDSGLVRVWNRLLVSVGLNVMVGTGRQVRRAHGWMHSLCVAVSLSTKQCLYARLCAGQSQISLRTAGHASGCLWDCTKVTWMRTRRTHSDLRG